MFKPSRLRTILYSFSFISDTHNSLYLESENNTENNINLNNCEQLLSNYSKENLIDFLKNEPLIQIATKSLSTKDNKFFLEQLDTKIKDELEFTIHTDVKNTSDLFLTFIITNSNDPNHSYSYIGAVYVNGLYDANSSSLSSNNIEHLQDCTPDHLCESIYKKDLTNKYFKTYKKFPKWLEDIPGIETLSNLEKIRELNNANGKLGKNMVAKTTVSKKNKM